MHSVTDTYILHWCIWGFFNKHFLLFFIFGNAFSPHSVSHSTTRHLLEMCECYLYLSKHMQAMSYCVFMCVYDIPLSSALPISVFMIKHIKLLWSYFSFFLFLFTSLYQNYHLLLQGNICTSQQWWNFAIRLWCFSNKKSLWIFFF